MFGLFCFVFFPILKLGFSKPEKYIIVFEFDEIWILGLDLFIYLFSFGHQSRKQNRAFTTLFLMSNIPSMNDNVSLSFSFSIRNYKILMIVSCTAIFFCSNKLIEDFFENIMCFDVFHELTTTFFLWGLFFWPS